MRHLLMHVGAPGEHGYGQHVCEEAHRSGLPLFRCTCAFTGVHVVSARHPSCVVGGAAGSRLLAGGFTLRFNGGASPQPTATLICLAPPGQASLLRFVTGGTTAAASAPHSSSSSLSSSTAAAPSTRAYATTSHRKRKTSVVAQSPQWHAQDGSRFGACPVCGANIALLTMNAHLDSCLTQHEPSAPANSAAGAVAGDVMDAVSSGLNAATASAIEEPPGSGITTTAATRPPEPCDRAASAPATLYTVGHSNQTISEFLAKLHAHGVTLLCDVRTVPQSAHAPQFNRDALREACLAAGVAYEWYGHALGGRFVDGGVHGRIASEEGRTALGALAARAAAGGEAAGPPRLAIMCSEARWCDCHRSVLARELVARHRCPVMHITPSGKLERHPMPILERLQGASESRAALVAEWQRLMKHRLPALATEGGWPVQDDHCFMRLALDSAFEDCWYNRLDRKKGPAIHQITTADLARAVAAAQRMETEGEAAVIELNEASLRWRSAGTEAHHPGVRKSVSELKDPTS